MAQKNVDCARQLFRDSLRLADFLSTRNGNRESLRHQVRVAFRKNMKEVDPKKIEEQKEAARRGLSNYMFYEAKRMAKESKGKES